MTQQSAGIPPLESLGRMGTINRFFVYKLTDWSDAEQKFKKKQPWNGGETFGPHTANMSYADAVYLMRQCELVARPGTVYSLGWWLAEDADMWFLDLDKCVNPDGSLTEEGTAGWQFAAASGALFEYSSSGKGVHVIGSGKLAPHGNRKKNGTFELYSSLRGICFGRSGQAWGCASAISGVPERWILPATSEFIVSAVDSEGKYSAPDPAWNGPEDDGELLEKMRNAGTGVRRLQGKITLSQLLDGDRDAIAREWPEAADKDEGSCSDADMSLAGYLAFWTGRHLPRMVRLMRNSGLYRPKFDRDDYLQRTCMAACEKMGAVFGAARAVAVPPVAPVQEAAPAAVVLPPLPRTPIATVIEGDFSRGVDAARQIIKSAGNGAELEQACAQVVGMDTWTVTELADLRGVVKRVARDLNIELKSAEIRQMLPDEAKQMNGAYTVGAPAWISKWMFEGTSNRFYNMNSGKFFTTEATRVMMRKNPDVPRKENGKQDDPIELFIDPMMWNGRAVDVMQYAPDRDDVFEEHGTIYGNTYNPLTVPVEEPPIQADVDLVWNHIMRLCKQREDIAKELLYWLAWQVQRPGKLIRWAPLIIGRQGIGKGYLGQLLRAVCGPVNCKTVLPSDISNSGGFTDWAYGRAVSVIDEIHINGLEKYAIYNRVKPYLSEEYVSINRKGSSAIDIRNTTNYMAFSNFDDAVPMDEDDRRWLVIYAANIKLENGSIEQHGEYMKRIFDVIEQRPGALRGWLASVRIPEHWPISPMHTEDKWEMIGDTETSTVAAVRKYTNNGVFNLTDSYAQIKADAMLDGDRQPSKEALARAAKSSLKMKLVRCKVGGDGGRVTEKKLYVAELYLPFVAASMDAYLRWKDKWQG